MGVSMSKKPLAVQILAHRGHDRRADLQDRPLTRHANPQVTMVECEVHAVVFERHRVIHVRRLDNLQVA